jgi:hypothetical protein
MKDTCHLVLSVDGIKRMTKGAGSLQRGEVSVKIAVSIADICFGTPTVSASIDIPESAVIHPRVDVQVEFPTPETPDV